MLMNYWSFFVASKGMDFLEQYIYVRYTYIKNIKNISFILLDFHIFLYFLLLLKIIEVLAVAFTLFLKYLIPNILSFCNKSMRWLILFFKYLWSFLDSFEVVLVCCLSLSLHLAKRN